MGYLVTLAFVAIIGSLAFALFFMMRSQPDTPGKPSKRMAWALAMRVGVSIALFLCVLLAWYMGWIQPSGIKAGQ